MTDVSPDTTPYWASSATFPAFDAIHAPAHADVVVVGGGITGLTTAYLLGKAGKSVILLERGRCASMDTGHTTAHLTMVTDVRLGELARRFDRDHARAAWDAGLAAIALIEGCVREHHIEAGFARVDGYLHVAVDDPAKEQAASLRDDATLATELGFDVDYLDEVPLVGVPGLRVADQARLHPRRYLAAIAEAVVASGGRIHELTKAEEFSDAPRSVTANGHRITCDDVVIATHNPLVGLGSTAGATVRQTKLALYTSYVIGATVARGSVPDGLWWDTAEPYRYLRIQPGEDSDLVIFGGEDHKTGQAADTHACYEHLERQLRQLVPHAVPAYRWSGQVIETPDGLPYIGPTADHQYAATGYGGNGITLGTLGAMMMSDAILGRRNPWSDLFDPSRKALTRGLWDYLKENADYPYYMIRDRFAGAESRPLRSVARGHGQIIEHNGRKVAAYRDEQGALTLRSAVCPHMGCLVGWNAAERTWDCPCHGSRFGPAGDVRAGPAEAPLANLD